MEPVSVLVGLREGPHERAPAVDRPFQRRDDLGLDQSVWIAGELEGFDPGFLAPAKCFGKDFAVTVTELISACARDAGLPFLVIGGLALMFVNDHTFAGLFAASVVREVGSVPVRFPCLEHLIAMKLHVAKQGLRHRVLGDLDDIINLVLANRVDLREEEWRQLFVRYGTLELYDKVLHATDIF